jgi:hypothetical protein
MYKENDRLESVSDECIVRRYMSMTKFLSVLETNSLFFPSLSLLAKEDKFEGLFNLVDHPLPGLLDQNQIQNDFPRDHRRHFFVNCWTHGIHESYALWKIYLDNTSDGIAIETNFFKLKECFRSFSEDIFIGKVRYASGLFAGSRFFTCTTKRSPFEYEQEIRVIYEKVPLDEQGIPQVTLPPSQNGYFIPIDSQILFGRVVTSPFAPSWFHDLVRSVMNRYGYSHIEVNKSSLATEPI